MSALLPAAIALATVGCCRTVTVVADSVGVAWVCTISPAPMPTLVTLVAKPVVVRSMLSVATVARLVPVALAYDPPVLFAKVTMGEGSYLPGAIIFQIDLSAADCPAGALIVYDGGAALPPGTPAEGDRKSNVKATHTKGPVRVHARNKPQGGNCFGSS